MMRQCHLNTCPVGIATQDPELTKKLQRNTRTRHQLLYVFRCRRSSSNYGIFRISGRFNEMVGQVELLKNKFEAML